MKKRICALVAALLLFGAAASAAPAPLPEGMAYLAACRVEGETTGGVTFAVTQAAYDGASLTLEVLLTPNDEDTALMDNQVEVPPEDSWFLREREKAAALGDRVLGVACDLCGLMDPKGNNLALEYRCTPARRGRTMTYTCLLYTSAAGTPPPARCPGASSHGWRARRRTPPRGSPRRGPR